MSEKGPDHVWIRALGGYWEQLKCILLKCSFQSISWHCTHSFVLSTMLQDADYCTNNRLPVRSSLFVQASNPQHVQKPSQAPPGPNINTNNWQHLERLYPCIHQSDVGCLGDQDPAVVVWLCQVRSNRAMKVQHEWSHRRWQVWGVSGSLVLAQKRKRHGPLECTLLLMVVNDRGLCSVHGLPWCQITPCRVRACVSSPTNHYYSQATRAGQTIALGPSQLLS